MLRYLTAPPKHAGTQNLTSKGDDQGFVVLATGGWDRGLGAGQGFLRLQGTHTGPRYRVYLVRRGLGEGRPGVLEAHQKDPRSRFVTVTQEPLNALFCFSHSRIDL